MKTLLLLLLLPLAACGQIMMPGADAALGSAVPVASGAWTPATLGSQLKIWLKNESLIGDGGSTADGAEVGGWTDSSGNGYLATNSASGEKLYLTNTGTFGTGIKSAAIVAANDRLYLTNGVGVCRNVASASVVIVLQPIDMASVRNLFCFSRGTDTGNRFAGYVRATDDFVINGRRLDANSAESTDAGLTLGTLPIIVQFDADWANSAGYIWTNNVSSVSDSTWLTDGNTSDTDSFVATIGAPVSDSQYGWYAEVIVCVPRLSDANRTNVYNYLDGKFTF